MGRGSTSLAEAATVLTVSATAECNAVFVRRRPGAQRHARQHDRLRVDAVRHRHPQPVLRAAPVQPQEPPDQGGEQGTHEGGGKECIRM